jgi:hypothetical protein
MTDSLDSIDTSFWKLDEKQWVAARQASWPKIESMLANYKPRKGLSIIKAYYLKGKMPNWQALVEWMNEERHVDLMVFLWLHPSWDEHVLTELREAYVHSRLITPSDISAGFGLFLYSQATTAATPINEEDAPRHPFLEGHGEMLFRILFGDLSQKTINLDEQGPIGYSRVVDLPRPDIAEVIAMAKWLVLEKLKWPLQREFLYQYDQPLEWWYESVKDYDFFRADSSNELRRTVIEQALHRIHAFDTEKEGDSCRSNFANRIRTMFDERPFFDGFKVIWQRVKSGEIKINERYFRYR